MTDEELGRMLYPPDDPGSDYFETRCSYQPIIEWIGREIAEVSVRNYSGETFAVVERGGSYAFLCISWGSCSGCDALQRCDSFAELGSLARNIAEQARWFDSLAKCRAWINDDARKLEHEYYTDEWAAFVQAVDSAEPV